MKKNILFVIVITMFSQVFFAESCEKKCDTTCSVSKNFWMPRSFVSYSEHDLYQMSHAQAFKNERKLNFSFITDYMQNFGQKCNNCKNLGSLPFWSGTNSLTIGRNDGRAQLDAYQLGLGDVEVNEDGIAGTITLDPRVQHVGTDMMLYWVENTACDGFYFRVHMPLVAMSINPQLTMTPAIGKNNDIGFTQVSTGGTSFDYQFLSYSVPDRRPDNILNVFWGGEGRKDILQGGLGKSIRLDYGRVNLGKQTAIRLSDITASLGYNVFANEKCFVGIGFKFSCPTGNVPTALYLLEPIVGRAGLWGMGAEVCASCQIWANEEKTRHLTFSLDGEVLHLSSGRTPNYRSFDLRKNGPGSKYLLIQHYIASYASNSPDQNISNGSLVNPNYEIFTPGNLHQALNITTLPVKSKIDIEGSIAMMLDFVSHNWNASLGGECWGRSHEKLCIDRSSVVGLALPNLNHYAVVGRQLSSYHVPGLTVTNNNDDIYSYLCEPNAQIGKSKNAALLTGSYPGLTAPINLSDEVKDARLAENRIPENYNEALNIEGAAASHALTGKIFGQIGYTFNGHCYIPTLALIGGIEFTGTTNSAIQFWSMGCQVSFNF